jgi:hypothetical protein
MADKYTYGNRNQFLIDSVDRRMIELKEMEITRIFKPKIKMEDKK